jgi:hypothetical protein
MVRRPKGKLRSVDSTSITIHVRLFRTADFDCSRSGSLRTVFGTRLRLLFAIGSGLHCRGEKRDPVPDLLTSRAFLGTNPTGQLITSGLPVSGVEPIMRGERVIIADFVRRRRT